MNKKTIEYISYIYLAIYAVIFVVISRIISGEFLLYLNLITYGILGVVGIYIFRDYYMESFQNWKKQTFKNILWLIGALVVDVILQNIAAIPGYLYNPDYVSANQNSVSDITQYVPLGISLLILGVLGPVVEEHIFRVLLVRKLVEHMKRKHLSEDHTLEEFNRKKHHLVWIPVLLSAVLFATMHMHSFSIEEVLANLPLLTTGIVYGFVAYKSKNTSIPLIIHLLNNCAGVLGLYLAK